MKPVITMVLASMFAALLATGCLVQTRERRSSSAVKSCPPAYHWDNGACVHNGKAKGHYKHDHRK